ncbi:MAG: cache domain-containing protein [Candidatus Portnoybacteria bacterium]|nr:cache domain-containing protein [Candidatus Portnoybacteria bacterium]
MSSFFLLNNLHFGLELLGALVFLTVAWLLFDAYFIRREKAVMLRAIGFAVLSLWQIIHSFNISGDLASYIAFTVCFLGLLIIIISFLLEAKPLGIKAIIILPAFATFLIPLNTLVFIGLSAIAFLSYRRYKTEFNRTLIPFWAGFLLLSIAAFFSIFYRHGSTNFIWIIGHIFEIGGFLTLAWWIWQYLRMRLKESIILVFVATTFFMAVVVTLAFSTIFLVNIESTTKSNLLTNAKVLDFAILRLKEESLAKARFIVGQNDIKDALTKNNFLDLEQAASNYLEKEHLGFLVVVDGNADVILRAHALTQKEDNVSGERAVGEALKGNSFATIEASPAEKFSIRASAPVIIDGKIKGAIITGFPLDNAMVDGIKKITGLEMSVFEDETRVATTVLNPDGRTRSVGIKEADSEVKDSILKKGEPVTLRVEFLSRPFLASYLPMRDADEKIVGMISAAKPQQEILEIANATNRLTFITVALIMLILIAPITSITKSLIGEAI